MVQVVFIVYGHRAIHFDEDRDTSYRNRVKIRTEVVKSSRDLYGLRTEIAHVVTLPRSPGDGFLTAV